MGRYSYGGWAPYVSVAERRRSAARKARELGKQGHVCQPITIEGRTIARSFWAKAWCDNLEAYSDYENRLPRGRSYVRNGSVVDLQIRQGTVAARVSGSELYNVDISVRPLEPAPWKAIVKECAGKIGSLVELLQGRLSHAVMEVVTRRGTGLFPTPTQISFRCSCPDGANMCKHVAASLYGVGARLDHQPELLFVLRHMDPQELIRQAVSVPVTRPEAVLDESQRLKSPDLAGLFGIELDDAAQAPRESPPVHESNRRGKRRAPSEPSSRTGHASKSGAQRPVPRVVPAPAKKTATPPRVRGKTVTARELRVRGIPPHMLQNWLNAGVLLRTEGRGIYKTTAQTEERIMCYLNRSRAPHGE